MGALKAGETKTVEFEFHISDALRENTLVVELTVYDSVLHEAVNEKLKYPVRSDAAKPVREFGAIQIRKDRSPIFEGAADDAGIIAWTSRGAVFRTDARQGPWFRIGLGSKRPGFIRANQVKRTRRRPKHLSITPNWQVTPPALALQIPSYETSKSTYQLAGKATDETRVADVYVFVSNRTAKISNRKVFYKSNRAGRNPNTINFVAKIPLWPGSNRVTVVARENDAVRSTKTLSLYRNEAVK